MASVTILNIEVLNSPAKFSDPYEFEITFECLGPLKEDLEWKLVYVGSAASPEYDQELECLLVGPIPVGVNKFIFTAESPNPELIPQNDLVSVTIMLLTCSYRDRCFVQVGYFVNNEYDTEELRENPPTHVALDHVMRNILTEKPRVTRYQIPWDNEDMSEFPPEQPDVDVDEEDEGEYGNEEEDMLDEMADEQDDNEVEVSGDEDGDEDDGDDVDDGDEADNSLDANDSTTAAVEAGAEDDQVDEDQAEDGADDAADDSTVN